MAKDNPLIADTVDLQPITIPRQLLTVPTVALLLNKGKSQADIARIFGKTKQAVSKFIIAHSDELCDLKDGKELEALHYRAISRRLRNEVDETRLQKAGLRDLVLSAAICTDKAEQLSGNNQGDKLSFQVQVNIVNNQAQSNNNNELSSQDNDRGNTITEIQVNKGDNDHVDKQD